METKNNSSRIHPLIAAAAIGVLLVSLVGVAAITGLLPNSAGIGAPKTTVAELNRSAEEKAASDQAQAQQMIDQQKRDQQIKDQQARDQEEQRIAAENAARQAQARDRANMVAQAPRAPQAPRICSNCGRVQSVRAVQTAAPPSGVGIVAGAVVGGVLGNQVGGGTGRQLATVAGAVGGGYAGNEIEKRTRKATTYTVRVRMEDGRIRNFPYDHQPNWNSGDRVRVVDGYLRPR